MLEQALAESAAYIKNHYGRAIAGAVVLGSGLGDYADRLQNAVSLSYAEIPHFSTSSVEGHAGRLVIGEVRPGFSIACMQGRFHFYEGHAKEKVVYPIRVFRELGARFLMVTNAAGGINASFKPGTLMLIADHLNLMGTNPLIGKNFDFLGPRFPDMSEAYNVELRVIAESVAQREGIPIERGVYAAMTGPSYETPAEIRMLKTLGADAVGMSTVPEVIVANQMGMKVLGISCVTNLAAGISPHKLSHAEVIETTERVKHQFVTLVSGILNEMANTGVTHAGPSCA